MVESVYLLSYFLGNGETGAYLAVSGDGWSFTPLVEPNVPVIVPAVGPDKLMRDPCLAQGPDGLWHLVWTTGWWDRHVGYATSPDLLHWSEQRTLPVMTHEPDALNAWAPELVYEPQGQRWVLYWSTTIPGRFPATDPQAGPDASASGKPLNHRFYFCESHDNGATWSETKLLWDPGFNCIDATIIPDGESWLLIGKDETRVPEAHKWLFVARGESATGPFEIIAPRITGNYWAEGPTALKIENTWRLYFDRYQEDTWGAAESDDDAIHWREASAKLQMVPGARHGMVVKTTRSFVDTLRKALV